MSKWKENSGKWLRFVFKPHETDFFQIPNNRREWATHSSVFLSSTTYPRILYNVVKPQPWENLGRMTQMPQTVQWGKPVCLTCQHVFKDPNVLLVPTLSPVSQTVDLPFLFLNLCPFAAFFLSFSFSSSWTWSTYLLTQQDRKIPKEGVKTNWNSC